MEIFDSVQFSSIQSLSHVRLCDPMDCSTSGLPVHHQLLELAQTHIHRVGDAIQPSHPLSPSSPFAFSLSQHQTLCQWVSSSHQIVNFSFSISPSSEYSGLISFRIDWFDLPAVQGILKSSLAPEFENISSLVLNLLYGPTLTSLHDYWKNLSLTIGTFVSKVMSLLFNMLSRLVIAFLQRSMHLLISWLHETGWVLIPLKSTLKLMKIYKKNNCIYSSSQCIN